MIKVGLIGCGKIGQVRHLPEYAAPKPMFKHPYLLFFLIATEG